MSEFGPTEINTERASHLVKVHKGKLSFQYTGKGNHVHDVGSVQANRPFAVNELIGYFELRVTSAGLRGNIALGLTNQDFNIMRHPGKDSGSYGYQGDDGRKFEDNGQGETYGPKFGAEDVVGCGLHFGTREIFFTKNGQHLGVAFRSISHAYYPAVGLHSEGEAATLNFGAQPFVFPIANLIREEESKFSNSISRLHVEGATLHELVRQFLLHHGHVSTLKLLPCVVSKSHDKAASYQVLQVEQLCAADTHVDELSTCQATCQTVRRLMENSDSLGAIRLLESVYPSFLKESKMANAMLLSQVMMEQLARGDLRGAVAFAKESLAPLLLADAAQGDDEDGPYACDTRTAPAPPPPPRSPYACDGGMREGCAEAEEAGQAEADDYVRRAITLLATCPPCHEARGAAGICDAPATREAQPASGMGRPAGGAERGGQEMRDWADGARGAAGGGLSVPEEFAGRAVALKVVSLLREHAGEDGRSGLERLMQQLMAAHASLRLLQGGRGEALTLASVVRLKKLV